MHLPNRNGYVVVAINNRYFYKSTSGILYEPNDIIPIIKENYELDKENKLLKAQIQAASDRSDFLEDCIAEMATLVYNTDETT